MKPYIVALATYVISGVLGALYYQWDGGRGLRTNGDVARFILWIFAGMCTGYVMGIGALLLWFTVREPLKKFWERERRKYR